MLQLFKAKLLIIQNEIEYYLVQILLDQYSIDIKHSLNSISIIAINEQLRNMLELYEMTYLTVYR